MTYVQLAHRPPVDTAYAGHPSVVWQRASSPTDLIANVADPQFPDDPDHSWVILAGGTGRVVLQRAVCQANGDSMRSEWATVDEAIGYVLGGAL